VRFLSGVEDGRSGIIGPDTPPCSKRNRIRTGKLQAIPHRNEASVNSRIDSALIGRDAKIAADRRDRHIGDSGVELDDSDIDWCDA
jgi:hypothetical protein